MARYRNRLLQWLRLVDGRKNVASDVKYSSPDSLRDQLMFGMVWDTIDYGRMNASPYSAVVDLSSKRLGKTFLTPRRAFI